MFYDQFFIDELKSRADIARRVCVIAVCVVAAVTLAAGQTPPKPILVDEFGKVSCEELLGRTDAFFVELIQHPADTGLVSISSSSKWPDTKKLRIRTNVYMRQFDKNRLRIVIDSDGVGDATQFWRIPPGAELPKFKEVLAEPRDVSKPFLFGAADDLGTCPSFIPDDFVNLIRDNPGSYGKLVVYGDTWQARESLAGEFLSQLTKAGLSNKRVRFYYFHRPKRFFSEVEFWFIPTKKK